MSDLHSASDALRRATVRLQFSLPVAHVRPLESAGDAKPAYLERFGKPRKGVDFVGMNPGPYGRSDSISAKWPRSVIG